MNQPLLTVGMPAYNEAANLPRNVPRLSAKLDALGVDYEIVIVNDGSRDATPQLAEELARQNPRVRVVHHARNCGIGAGFRSAAQAAHGEYFIIIPADLALDLDELPKYLDAARDADVVVGLRSSRSDYTLYRRIISVVNIFIIRTLFGMSQRQFNYISLYRTRVLQAIDLQYTGSALFFAEILVKARDRGCRLVEIEVRYVPRTGGQATGANPRLIARTGRDVLHFWLTRLWARVRGAPPHGH